MPELLLEVRHLSVDFPSSAGSTRAVDDVSFTISPGETLGLVGESGSGKTMTALSILRLVPPPGRVTGEVIFGGGAANTGNGGVPGSASAAAGVDLMKLPPEGLRRVRGRDIGMIFQEPLSSLNPVFTCGDQVAEPLRIHAGLSEKAARERAIELLARVGLTAPARRAREYPHQLSGGMRQRVMIAMALALKPKLLIADEPTTALDVTIQAQILDLLARLREEDGLSLLLITHNLAVVASMADRVLVMHDGRFVEEGSVADIFERPREAYTRALLDAVPRLERSGGTPGAGAGRSADSVGAGGAAAVRDGRLLEVRGLDAGGAAAVRDGRLLEVRGLTKKFPIARDWLGRPNRWLTAVDDVSLDLHRGETLGLVGESGCGKTTLGRMLLRLIEPTRGEIVFDGTDLAPLGRRRMRPFRRSLQMVFQDPAGSLNPRLTVEELLTEPLHVHRIATGRAARQRAASLLEMVGLLPDHVRRYPHEFSGGQRQRIGIARALALSPRLLVLDEPVSALDVTIQAQVLTLLRSLKEKLELTYLFVAHDLAVVRSLSTRVAVMYLGQIVEMGAVDAVYEDPLHPYTKALLAAVPALKPERRRPAPAETGERPGPEEALAGPSGAAACRFAPRCPLAVESCRTGMPPLVEISPGRWLRCPVAAPERRA